MVDSQEDGDDENDDDEEEDQSLLDHEGNRLDQSSSNSSDGSEKVDTQPRLQTTATIVGLMEWKSKLQHWRNKRANMEKKLKKAETMMAKHSAALVQLLGEFIGICIALLSTCLLYVHVLAWTTLCLVL